MIIKLSESEKYKKAIISKVTGDYDLAEDLLCSLISEINTHTSYLYTCLADLHFEKKEILKAKEYYIKSIEIDSESLMPKLFYAKFLAFKTVEIENACELLNEIIEYCDANPFEKTDYDLGSEYYIDEAKAILLKLQST